ncbi:hypothetical protein [uncultured Campylobacter sp.]|uniref:type IV pilus modification PilV family protein n=1 Tax=uncultured Campylobacter sp. TaxID=218934 RepID=UPI002626F7EC|nr:hypothetical protein [uncultured Campylobacter sp.]
MKRGFSLIAAIFFIILVATTAITALSIAAMTARDVNNIRSKEQALLLAQSATEFAVMAMQAHNYPNPASPAGAGTNCLETINLTYPNANNPEYNIAISIYYLDPNLGCTAANMIGARAFLDSSGNPVPNNVVTTHMALVDVTVTSTDLPRITYNRRTLQKP